MIKKQQKERSKIESPWSGDLWNRALMSSSVPDQLHCTSFEALSKNQWLKPLGCSLISKSDPHDEALELHDFLMNCTKQWMILDQWSMRIKNMQWSLRFVWRKMQIEEREFWESSWIFYLKLFVMAVMIRVLLFIFLANHTENQFSHSLNMISELWSHLKKMKIDTSWP